MRSSLSDPDSPSTLNSQGGHCLTHIDREGCGIAGTRKPWWRWRTRCSGQSNISWPRARRTVSRASTTTIAATLTESHAARSNCLNARVTAWFSNRLPKRVPRLTGDFLSSSSLVLAPRVLDPHHTLRAAAVSIQPVVLAGVVVLGNFEILGRSIQGYPSLGVSLHKLHQISADAPPWCTFSDSFAHSSPGLTSKELKAFRPARRVARDLLC